MIKDPCSENRLHKKTDDFAPVIRPPIPGGGDGDLVYKLIKIVKILYKIFKKPSKETGKIDSINDSSSPDDFQRIMDIFNDFRNQVYYSAEEIESAVNDEVNYYVDEFVDILNNNPDIAEKYDIHIKRANHRIGEITSKIHESMDKIISHKVSLDNRECRVIIQMVSGTKKEEAMRKFFDETLNEALECCCSEIRSCLGEIYEDVESEVVDAVDSLQKQSEIVSERLYAIDEDNYEESSKKQIAESMYIIGACDYIEQIV